MANKYKNRRTTVGGIKFQSNREARRWKFLRLLEDAGEIVDLRRQVKFELIPAQRIEGKLVEHSCSYYADFVYVDRLTGKTIIEDVKGYKTPEYVIKRKLMLHKYGIRIKET